MSRATSDRRPRVALAGDLRRLGVGAGDILLVHASFRSLGPVGDPANVVRSLKEVLGPGGTLVVPTMTADNSDPSRWAATRGQAAPADRWAALRETMPPFDPATTASFRMGALAEAVRTSDGAVRSAHPQTSFAALGPHAEVLMAGHDWRCHLGEDSPLARLADHDAKVLLLGVTYAVCTAFHLAEYRLPTVAHRDYECVVLRDGEREWFRYRDVVLDDSRFAELGRTFERSQPAVVRVGRVGRATSRLFPIRPAVDFAADWFRSTPGRTVP